MPTNTPDKHLYSVDAPILLEFGPDMISELSSSQLLLLKLLRKQKPNQFTELSICHCWSFLD